MNTNQADGSAKASFAPTIFLLSGGIGASAEQLVHTVLAQFPENNVPPALFDLDPRRVVGLTVDPEQLLVYRRQRQKRLGVSGTSDYTDLESIQQEIQHSRQVFRRGNFHIINMSDKTIEQGADEIIRKLSGEANAMT